MKKQTIFSLIGILLIIGALIITAGGVVVWEKRVELTPLPIPTSIPLPKDVNPKYLGDESYCEKDSDCTTRPSCCNPCYKDYVNIYHQGSIPKEQCQTMCKQDCPPPSKFGPPVCRNNKCTSLTTSVSCQTSADCPPVTGVCMPWKCPTYECLNGRCVFFEDAMVLRSCLKEVMLQECVERYGQ